MSLKFLIPKPFLSWLFWSSHIRAAADEEKRIEQEAAAAAKEAESQLEDGDEESAFSNFDLILPIVLDLADKVVELKNGSVVKAPFTAARLAALMQKDCFLVFRSLCKLSMKPLPGKLDRSLFIKL